MISRKNSSPNANTLDGEGRPDDESTRAAPRTADPPAESASTLAPGRSWGQSPRRKDMSTDPAGRLVPARRVLSAGIAVSAPCQGPCGDCPQGKTTGPPAPSGRRAD